MQAIGASLVDDLRLPLDQEFPHTKACEDNGDLTPQRELPVFISITTWFKS